MILDENEVSHHVDEDGRIDYGADADHVAIDDTGYDPVGGEPAPDPVIDMWRETPGNVIMFEPMPPGTPPEWKGAYVMSANGTPFNVRFIPAGSKEYNFATGEYTRDADHDVIAFFDARYGFTPHGQHVSTYRAEDLIEGDRGVGLNLHGGIDDWTLDAESTDGIKGWAGLVSENK
ncbi:hypothetical protein [Aeromicrobium sp. 179-A 4D2 NHS]|uniref:hypothetical protein n=1 Tax=Aeromicrobium sp. 179-A 4D2 NHS TaxID=3142375 RepID=UPI0039A2B607